MVLEFFDRFVLKRNSASVVRSISVIGMVGVAIGMSSLVIVTSVMSGFNSSFTSRLLAIEPHLSFPAGPNMKANSLSFADYEKSLNNSLVALIKNQKWRLEKVDHQDVILRTNEGGFGGAAARGMSLAAMKSLAKDVEELGKEPVTYFPESLEALGPNEVFVGAELARSLDIFEGDEIFVMSPESLVGGLGMQPLLEKVKVKARWSTRVAEFDSRALLFNPKSSLRRVAGPASRRTYHELRIENPDEIEKIQNNLETLGFESENWRERNRVMFFALKVEKLAMTVFLSLSILITGFSVISVLVILMRQKKRELALLRAIGYSRSKLTQIFSWMGFLISATGVFVGTLLGLGVSLYIQAYPLKVLPDIYYDNTIPAQVSWINIVGILLTALLLSFVGSWIAVRSNLEKNLSTR